MINRQENHVYGLNQGVLLEMLKVTDGAIAEVCNVQRQSCDGYVNDLANVIVTYVLIDEKQTRGQFHPMRAEGFMNENVRQATVIILNYLRPMCNNRKRVSRLARISTYVNQPQVA